MSDYMRLFILVGTIIFVFYILLRIQKLKIKMEDAVFWIFFMLIIAVLGTVPQIVYWLSNVLGIQSPANLVFLLIIGLLIEKLFTLSVTLSMLEEKVAILSAEIAIRGRDVLHTDTGFHQSPIDTRLRTEKEARATIRKNRVALKLSGVLFPVINRVLEGMHTNQGSRSDIDYGKRSENVVLLGACLFFSREYMDRCEDAFYPETQFFYEEYILKCRCERLGLKMIYDPQIKVLHEGGASTWQSYKDRRKRLKFALYHTMKGCQVYLNYKKGAKFERHCDW